MTKAKALTEEQWLASGEPYTMMRHLQQHCLVGRAVGGKRRQRLFAVACCRRAWHLFDDRGRRVIEVAERVADGRAGRRELAAADADARAALRVREDEARSVGGARELAHRRDAHRELMLAYALQAATSNYLSISADGPSGAVASALAPWDPQLGPTAVEAELRLHAGLLRDIFHNPFRPPPALDLAAVPAKGGPVTAVARTIYDEHRFAELPVLADALEEAGCADAEILDHLRADKPHARGCWALDLILGVP